jgi:hypothetical protein
MPHPQKPAPERTPPLEKPSAEAHERRIQADCGAVAIDGGSNADDAVYLRVFRALDHGVTSQQQVALCFGFPNQPVQDQAPVILEKQDGTGPEIPFADRADQDGFPRSDHRMHAGAASTEFNGIALMQKGNNGIAGGPVMFPSRVFLV